MAIVIFANDEDKQKLDDALKAAGLEYDILEPTVKNILHLAIGLADDTSEEETSAEDESAADEEAAEADIVDTLTNDEEKPVGESLGVARFNGEALKLFKSTTNENIVFVQNLIPGAKTTYSLNESVVSFWVDNTKDAEQFGFLEMVLESVGPRTYMGSFQIRQSPTTESFVTIATSSLELLARA
jgi:hypothetical protein